MRTEKGKTMKAKADRSNQDGKGRATNADRLSQKPVAPAASLESPEAASLDSDNKRPEAIAQRKLQNLANGSLRIATQRKRLEGIVEANDPPLLQRRRDTAGYRQPLQFDNDFTFSGGTVEKTTIDNQTDLNAEVDEVIDERYGGYRNLFLVNEVASSPSQWARKGLFTARPRTR